MNSRRDLLKVGAMAGVLDPRKIKVTSDMVGAAMDLHPALAKEIVQRGHEASRHEHTWTAQFSVSEEN